MKWGLALSGGALRGAVHIGVLEVLEEEGIRPDMIAGTSAGSLVGALYGAGISPYLLRQVAENFPGGKMIDWTFATLQWMRVAAVLPFYYLRMRKEMGRIFPSGLIRGEKWETYIRKLLRLPAPLGPIPVYVVTTDLYSGKSVIFGDELDQLRYEPSATVLLPMHDMAEVVRASTSIPGVFMPKQIGDYTLIDGSLRENVPADLLFALGCDKVIAVDLSNVKTGLKVHSFMDVINRSIDIMMDDITSLRLYDKKVYSIIPELPAVGLTDFKIISSLIDMGRQAVTAALPEIREYLTKNKG